jgi:hypothetical protein
MILCLEECAGVEKRHFLLTLLVLPTSGCDTKVQFFNRSDAFFADFLIEYLTLGIWDL